MSVSDNQFDSKKAKEALLELLCALNEDPQLKKIKENSSNDMLKYIQTFLPYSMDIQTRIIGKYGFTQDNAGLVKFTNRVKQLAIEDDNISSLFESFKSLLIPPLNMRTQFV